MEKITTQPVIGSGKKDSLIFGLVEETIGNRTKKSRNPIQKFKAFCEGQQDNRLGWTAFTMAGQMYLIVPITLFAVYCNGNQFALWIPVIISSFVIEVSNLASLPTKISIPIFCVSVLINVSVIMLSFML